jgi:hypothetical protein
VSSSLHSDLTCVVAEEQWAEAEHELEKRLSILVGRRVLSTDQADPLREDIRSLIDAHVLSVIPRNAYERSERRVAGGCRGIPTGR